MSQELTGLKYLEKNEIKNMKCNMDKPFAFISYSHDDYDSLIVMNVFKELMSRGHNLWIDTANMPVDEHSWEESATEALINKNCKLSFFFRSERSMVKETIAEELDMIHRLNHIKSIVAVDIWQKDDMNADTYLARVLNGDSKENIHACRLICKYVSTECKAIRLAGDADNDIKKLADEMEEQLKTIEDNSAPTNVDIGVDNTGEDENLDKVEVNDEDDKVSDDNNSDEGADKRVEAVEIVSDGSIYHIKGRNGTYDAFYRKDGDKYVVLAGSKLRYNEKWTPKKIWEQYRDKITNEGILLCDINNLPISTAAKLIEGTSTSGKELDTNDSLMAVGETYEVSFDSSKTATDTGIIIDPEKDDPEDVSEFILNGEPLGPGPMHPVEKTLWEYNTKGTRSKLMWNGETTGVSAVITVLKGSTVAAPSPNFEKSCKPAYTLKADLEAKGIIQNGKFTQDYTYDKVSTMMNLLNGGSVSTPREVNSGHLRKLDEKNRDVVKGKEDIADDIEDVLDDDMNDGDVGMATTSGFEYTLWGISHTSNKMSDMMNDVFDLIAERYPDRIEDIAEDDTITAVARKEDIDEGKIQGSKTANQFAHFNKREHSLNGQIYYVNAGYNREGGIRQLCKMLIICDGNADGLKITKMPEKSSHSGGNTGKKGLGELL